ncbi:FhaA domain-containing protein [Thermorudis peleae]|uniref:FhaA domain-containing protein n=1 Tax=Thermorudis peleae TaxID=1382356 RepID=UPI00056FAC1B|nr:DUF3662 and FHA domain-containing protein [Thermorudis peleae]
MINSIQRFEDFVQRIMEGSVGRIFRTPIQPVEIGRRLERAMESQKLSTVEGPIVPNDYLVRLNPEDLVQFADFLRPLCNQLEEWLLDLAEERGYGFIDLVRVRIVGDSNIPRRNIQVEASIAQLPDYDPAVEAEWQQTQVFRALEETGNVPPKFLRIIGGPLPEQTFLIRQKVTTIGRAPDNDVILEVPEVSRHHARLEYHQDHYEIVDLNSTNGTMVNGRPVTRSPITDGDRLTLGTVSLQILPYQGPTHGEQSAER